MSTIIPLCLRESNKTLQYIRSVTMFTGQEVSKEQLGPLYYIQLLEENRQITFGCERTMDIPKFE